MANKKLNKFTPGPWLVVRNSNNDELCIVGNAGGCPDAVLAVVGYDCPEESILKNALLIAAAPDMLEVLINTLAEIKSDSIDEETILQIEKAIAKALGEA